MILVAIKENFFVFWLSAVIARIIFSFDGVSMHLRQFLSEFRLYICNHLVGIIPSHTVRAAFYKNIMGFRVGADSAILMGCTFDAKGEFFLGDGSVINACCRIDTRGGVFIGDGCSISSDVVILTSDHDMDSFDFAGRNKSVYIEDDVWIGTRATVLAGVRIGRGAVVAAGALVLRDVEAYSLVAGVPAKFVRKRLLTKSMHHRYKRLFQ